MAAQSKESERETVPIPEPESRPGAAVGVCELQLREAFSRENPNGNT